MKIVSKLRDISLLLRTKWMTITTTASFAKREDLRFCYDSLAAVSRSFSIVIFQLEDPDLRDGVCLFYLILRALDTIEDDMKLDIHWKINELKEFHTHLGETDWSLREVGVGRERELLEQFPRVSREYNKLKPAYQEVIKLITQQMADGMIQFLQRPVVTIGDFDLYCHYVAGLVGIGITSLLARCGFEDPHLAANTSFANEMGLFLQKTNIIRDYFEDIYEEPPRMFWPKEIWGNYGSQLKDFSSSENKSAAVACLNHMVANALTHVPAVLDYITKLKNTSVIRFCGIPQVMAIGTLCEVYNNYDTFKIKVKLSKVDACRIMLGTNSTRDFLILVREFTKKLQASLIQGEPQTPIIESQLRIINERVETLLQSNSMLLKEGKGLKGALMCPFRISLSLITSPFRFVQAVSGFAIRSLRSSKAKTA